MSNKGFENSEVHETLTNLLNKDFLIQNDLIENNERAGVNSSFEVLHSHSSGEESKLKDKPSQDLPIDDSSAKK